MHRTMKILATILSLTMISGIMLTGCSSNTTATTKAEAAVTTAAAAVTTIAAETTTPASGTKTIALIPPAMISPYYASVIKGAQAMTDTLGYKLVIVAPQSESDYAAQVQIVEDEITQKVDGIILCAIDTDAIISAVKKANTANIPVVMFNTPNELSSGTVASYIRYDQREGGKKIADFVGEYFKGKGNVAIIEGLPSSHTTERKGGFVDELTAKYPDMKVVASQPGDWEREKGMNAATNMLQANPEINVFFALSGEMGLGAVQAIKQAGSDAKVCSFDGTPNEMTSILAGEMLSTLSIGGEGTGTKCIEVMADIFSGKTVEQVYNVDTILVTIDNAKDFPAA